MAVTSTPFRSFLLAVGTNDLDLTADTFKIILVNAYTFDVTHDTFSDISANEIANGNGYTTGGQSLSNVSWAWNSGISKWKWDADDLTWTAVGGAIGPANGAIIFDNTTSDKKLVAFIDFGQSETAGQDTDFKITFGANGIFTFGLV